MTGWVLVLAAVAVLIGAVIAARVDYSRKVTWPSPRSVLWLVFAAFAAAHYWFSG